MKYFGVILIIFGCVDLMSFFAGFDLWVDLFNIQLPKFLWEYSSLIAFSLGIIFYTLGVKKVKMNKESDTDISE